MAEPGSASARSARVLVVDDEPLLLKAYQRIVPAPHRVVPVTGCAEALAELARDGSFDVIFCDFQMPGGTGIELYREIERRWPAMLGRFVLVSGDPTADPPASFLAETRCRYIAKPFRVAELLAEIQAALGR